MRAFKNMQQAAQVRLCFPLEKYGYTLEEVLNNENRHHIKMVCSTLRHEAKGPRFVSTTYARHSDYLRLIETTTYLRCNNKLVPEIVELYPRDNTTVCRHIGYFLSAYFVNNPDRITRCITAAFEYIKEINCINQRLERFVIPSIVRISLALLKELNSHFDFLPESRVILPRLEKEGILFLYGCGLEDPHIWNFRIVSDSGNIKALTTDFDYFQDKINYFWELGYFYATFRWFRKTSSSLAHKAEKILVSLAQKQDLKSEFMFWLGVLSSYCGYRDSLLNITKDSEITELRQQHQTIKRLDEKISYLANGLLSQEKVCAYA